MKTRFISFIIFYCVQFTAAQEMALIPYPNLINMTKGELTYQEAIPFSLPSDLMLDPATIISQAQDYRIRLINQEKGNAIRFKKIKKLANEAYQLIIDKKGITIRYSNRAGAFYALQTLNQLIQSDGSTYTIPYTTIADQPVFHWRAYILDESRRFLGIEVVKTYLDEMSRLKMNTLQWHLVDNEGWRIKIDKYPKLTSAGSKGYYTKEEIRDIIAYAEARCITIVPEIEIPGHASAAIRAYPELGTLSKTKKREYGQIFTT